MPPHPSLFQINARVWLAQKLGIASVSAIARRYGFRDLGRFAANYRALYGESPSATLRRRLRSAADTEVSKEIENPVTRRITLPLRYEADFLDGAYKATKDTFEIDQAVVPFRLNEDWALITRTKLPVEVLPPKISTITGPSV